jgi:hypothetical protein
MTATTPCLRMGSGLAAGDLSVRLTLPIYRRKAICGGARRKQKRSRCVAPSSHLDLYPETDSLETSPSSRQANRECIGAGGRTSSPDFSTRPKHNAGFHLRGFA